MPYSFGQLKAELRPEIWPSGEAGKLVAAHNRMFLDAIIDLQQTVDCLQFDNTSLFPQCATYYNCGLTSLPAPRGSILEVSVIDKINPTTHKEDATAEDDWCSKIVYRQIDFCHIRNFMMRAGRGCCDLPLFFGFPGHKGRAPVPTDAGLAGLASLPLGFHYGQTSTDDPHGRSHHGVWAMERGKIYIAPWIQSTETVVIKWDGIKRTWGDSDPVDDDPQLKTAIAEYVRWKHAGMYDKDVEEEQRAGVAYATAVQWLMHACREETRIRGCETSHARGGAVQSGTSSTPLFFNAQQQATATCPDGQAGKAITITIPAGTVASIISLADANAKALNEAQQQANAQLDCSANADTFPNDAQSFTAQCQPGEAGAPAPDGNPVTVTVPAGTINSSISKADANQAALTLAQQQATDQLQCTFWNAKQTYTATCPEGQSGPPVTFEIGAHLVSSTISQADADAKALNSAKTQAEAQIICNGSNGVFTSTQQLVNFQKVCRYFILGRETICNITVTCIGHAGLCTSLISIADANQQARNLCNQNAQNTALLKCGQRQCGNFTINI
jgi:hypothetical protein